MNIFNFIGIGSAFNVELGNTAAFLNYGNEKILFDCGELIFARLKVTDFWTDESPVHVFITHNHPDHIGSLGSFIFYSYLIKHAKVFVYGNKDLKTILKLTGVKDDMFSFVEVSDKKTYSFPSHGFSNDSFVIAPVKTEHADNLESVAYLIKDTVSGNCFYYGGDEKSIPEIILQKFNEKKITSLFLDVSWLDYPDSVHLSYKNLCNLIDSNRGNVYIMHIDENFNTTKALADGFKVIGKE